MEKRICTEMWRTIRGIVATTLHRVSPFELTLGLSRTLVHFGAGSAPVLPHCPEPLPPGTANGPS
jgi:hypothetical protein